MNKHAHDHVEGSREGGGKREIAGAKSSRRPIWKAGVKSERRVTRFGLGVGSDWGSRDMENGTQELVRDEGCVNSGDRVAHALHTQLRAHGGGCIKRSAKAVYCIYYLRRTLSISAPRRTMDEMERVPLVDEFCELPAFFCKDRLVLFLALCNCVNFRTEHGLSRAARVQR